MVVSFRPDESSDYVTEIGGGDGGLRGKGHDEEEVLVLVFSSSSSTTTPSVGVAPTHCGGRALLLCDLPSYSAPRLWTHKARDLLPLGLLRHHYWK